jgi:hypothetical protein
MSNTKRLYQVTLIGHPVLPDLVLPSLRTDDECRSLSMHRAAAGFGYKTMKKSIADQVEIDRLLDGLLK